MWSSRRYAVHRAAKEAMINEYASQSMKFQASLRYDGSWWRNESISCIRYIRSPGHRGWQNSKSFLSSSSRHFTQSRCSLLEAKYSMNSCLMRLNVISIAITPNTTRHHFFSMGSKKSLALEGEVTPRTVHNVTKNRLVMTCIQAPRFPKYFHFTAISRWMTGCIIKSNCLCWTMTSSAVLAQPLLMQVGNGGSSWFRKKNCFLLARSVE